MDSEGVCSALELVEDNEEIGDSENSGNFGELKVQNKGSFGVEHNDNNVLFPEVTQKAAEVLAYVNSPPVDLKREVSPSPKTARKGHGLKKWRRIKRDAHKGGDSSIDAVKMVTRELSNSGVNPSKWIQYAERKQKSEGSVSSTDALVRNLDAFALFDDSGLGLGPPFAAETDSENSEGQSSKSSTAASAPKIKYEIQAVMGFPRNRSRMKSSSEKNLAPSVQRDQQGKGRIETTKKPRGKQVKIEKENSHSSLESDSRSSNFVFMQGIYSTDNGIRNERPFDEEDRDEVQGSGEKFTHGHQGGCSRDGEGAYEELSPEDSVADSFSEIKEERSKNHGSLTDQDPLVGSKFAVKCAQDALSKEVLKFKEIGKDVSDDDSVSDLCTEFMDVKQKLQETSSGQLAYGEGEQSFSRAVPSDVVETGSKDVEAEHEDLFKQKIETEVLCIALSRTVQKLRVATVDQITVLEEQKALASDQTQILDKLGHVEDKAAMLKKEAEKLEFFCEDIACADETLKLQKRVCKYTSCFFVQLAMFAVTLGVFVLQLSPDYVEVVPT